MQNDDCTMSAVMAYAARRCVGWLCAAFVAMALVFGGCAAFVSYQYSDLIKKIVESGIEVTSQELKVEQDAKDGGSNTLSGVNVTNKADK